MKQLPTTENEMMLFPKNAAPEVSADNDYYLPGKQIISNILNYAKSLQVLKRRNGEALFLLGN